MMAKNLVLAGFILVGVLGYVYHLGASEMLQVKVDIGHNIVETAKASGAPRWSTGNVDGFISYEVLGLPPDIPVLYQRVGYEIKVLPIYSLTMYADKKKDNNLAVQAISLMFDTDEYKSHATAKKFIEDLLTQFQGGKWTRHLNDLCPAVTGRSSFLNEAGEPDTSLKCPMDPAYRLSMDDWIQMMYMGKSYEWMGEGVLATLDVRYSDDIRGITYSIDLSFDDFAAKKRVEEANRLRDLAEGDANGWKSTENEAKALAARKIKVKILEENARKRGDAVVQR